MEHADQLNEWVVDGNSTVTFSYASHELGISSNAAKK
jgi:hypothetical protein